MNRNIYLKSSAPVHRTTAKTAVAKFNCCRHDKSVIDDRLPVGRRKGLENSGVETDVPFEFARERIPAAPGTGFNDVDGKFFEFQKLRACIHQSGTPSLRSFFFCEPRAPAG